MWGGAKLKFQVIISKFELTKYLKVLPYFWLTGNVKILYSKVWDN